jgi:hypothetical protein
VGCRTRFRDIPQPFVCGVLIDDARLEGVPQPHHIPAR